MADFIAWPKTSRLFRDVTVTEKIDGTNACIVFEPGGDIGDTEPSTDFVFDEESVSLYRIGAQSRKRVITPWNDNFGFARWAHDNAGELFAALGQGRHYGEWWGAGIQRTYGMSGKRFSLFNTAKHEGLNRVIGNVPVQPVPTLYHGTFSESAIDDSLRQLACCGSLAAPGFDSPEGVCVYHSQSRQVYKITLDHNDAGKWEH